MLEPESLIEECRMFAASIIVRRANAVLRDSLQKDSERGLAALNQSIGFAIRFSGLQSEITKRIIYRPPIFILTRDNHLRQAAQALLTVLIKARRTIATGTGEGKDHLLAEIDMVLGSIP